MTHAPSLEDRLRQALHDAADEHPVRFRPWDPAQWEPGPVGSPAPGRRFGARGLRGRSGKIMGGALVGVLVACGAGAVAAERLTSQPVTNKSVVHCHSTDSLTGGRNYSGSDVASAASPSGTNPEDALQACRLLWSAGLLVPGARHALSLPNPLSYDHPVPPLAVCRMPDGTAGVFPGASPVCSRLGLPTAGAA